MENAPQVPMQVWDFALTWIPRICTCVGALALLYWWKMGKLPGGAANSRRVDDKILDRILNSQDNMSKAFNNLADALREQGRDTSKSIMELGAEFGRGLRALHERVDFVLPKKH